MWVRVDFGLGKGEIDIELENSERWRPPPGDRRIGDGWKFYLHIPRRGNAYLYWPPGRTRVTERDVIKAKQWGAQTHKALVHGGEKCDCA
jgi:hypothetical protein